MKDPIVVQEGSAVPLSAFLLPQAAAEDRERIRRQVARRSRLLQRDLSLREQPLRVDDSDDEPVIAARGIAGTVRLGGRELDIRPKHVQDQAEDWRASLVTMLERSAPRRAAYARTRRLQLRHRTFIDRFAYGYALELEAATQQAPVRTYRSQQEEHAQVRGRLLVAEQLRRSLTRPHRLVCEVNSLDPDNPTNHLLHWVGRRLVPLVADAQVRRFLSYQLGRLPTVSEPVTLPAPLIVVLPRQYAHYSGAIQLALAFARGRTTFPGVSDVGGAGFIVGTERLFESFLERTLLAVAPKKAPRLWRVRPQESEAFAVPESGGRPYYSRPLEDPVVARGRDRAYATSRRSRHCGLVPAW